MLVLIGVFILKNYTILSNPHKIHKINYLVPVTSKIFILQILQDKVSIG